MKLQVNGKSMDFPAALRLDQLLEQLSLNPQRSGIAVAVNDEIVPRQEWAAKILGEGDRVEIVHAVQGG
ncbi:MAG: sulfur carrier protein ThiS [Acidobacteria bacterium]|nr:sulfur carrier protein ThiS [Acidobacteriota bacterium]